MKSRFEQFKQDSKEIFESRSILVSLIRKNLFGRYKNSLLGFSWHFIMPLIMLVVYYVVFTEIRRSAIPNFWVYITSALFPFFFMISNLTSGSGTIVSSASMIKKMYIPRELFVIAQVLSSLIVMLIGYSIVVLAIAISGYPLNYAMLCLLVPLIISMTLFVTGYVLFFSSLTVYIRDVQYFLTSLNMVFFVMTPMYFMPEQIAGILGEVIWINPFTYYVMGYHSIVYFGQSPELNVIVMCVLLPVLSLIVGIYTFHKLKGGFAERL